MASKVYILGYGNLGKHLLKLFLSRGIEVGGIFTNQRLDLKGVQTFSKSQVNEVLSDQDIVFITTKDDEIHFSIQSIFNESVVKLYCSGSIALSVFDDCRKVGVWYPLYSFSGDIEINWNLVPVFIEFSDAETQLSLEKLNKLLNLKVQFLSSQNRSQLHLSAVFANNFVNACFIGSNTVIENHDQLKFDYLLPIIQQTIDKLKLSHPMTLQTGPAKRGDEMTMLNHLKQLENFKEEADVYVAISKYIQQKFK